MMRDNYSLDTGARWLVCASAAQFLDIAPKLVSTGCAHGITWEPAVATALAKIQTSGKHSLNVIVAAGCEGAHEAEAAALLSASGARITVLCDEDPRERARSMDRGGADIVITPGELLGILTSFRKDDGLGDAADADFDKQEPQPSVQSARQAAFPSEYPKYPDEQSSKQHGLSGLRASGSFPKIGVEQEAKHYAQRPFVPASDQAGQDGKLPRRETIDASVPHIETSMEPVEQGQSAQAQANIAMPTPAPVIEPAIVVDPLRLKDQRPVPTICFASSRGGVGKSTLATLMAVVLARSGLHVALIDLDYQFGTCLGYLGADETDGLGEAVDGKLMLDDRALARCRACPEPGLDAYEFCRLPERSELLIQVSGALVRAARSTADIAIVDLPTGVSEGVAQVLEVSDRCLIVCDQRALSLESVGALTALYTRAGVPITKLIGVINRCDVRHKDETFLSRARFEVNLPQIMHVIDGGADVDRMLAIGCAGQLVSMRNRAALSVSDMATTIKTDLGLSVNRDQSLVSRAMHIPSAHPTVGSKRRGARVAGRRDLVACPS